MNISKSYQELVHEMLESDPEKQLELSKQDLLTLARLHDGILKIEHATPDLDYGERFLLKHIDICNVVHHLLKGIPKLSQPSLIHSEISIRVLIRALIENVVLYLWIFKNEHKTHDRKLILLWMELHAIHHNQISTASANEYFELNIEWLRRPEQWSRLEAILKRTIKTRSEQPVGSTKLFEMEFLFKETELHKTLVHTTYRDYSDAIHTNGRTLSQIRNIPNQGEGAEKLKSYNLKILFMINSSLITRLTLLNNIWKDEFEKLPAIQQNYFRAGESLFLYTSK